jgi:hypothetical protein
MNGERGIFIMSRLLFALAAIIAIAVFAVLWMDGQQMRVVDDSAHRQCLSYVPGTPLYVQCRGRVIQPNSAEHQEALAR